MISWIIRWWHKRQRAIDLDILWPACRDNSGGDLTVAKAAFAFHAYHDPAWLELGEDEIYRRIEELT